MFITDQYIDGSVGMDCSWHISANIIIYSRAGKGVQAWCQVAWLQKVSIIIVKVYNIIIILKFISKSWSFLRFSELTNFKDFWPKLQYVFEVCICYNSVLKMCIIFESFNSFNDIYIPRKNSYKKNKPALWLDANLFCANKLSHAAYKVMHQYNIMHNSLFDLHEDILQTGRYWRAQRKLSESKAPDSLVHRKNGSSSIDLGKKAIVILVFFSSGQSIRTYSYLGCAWLVVAMQILEYLFI
jgi:hypothetical protein